jgi:hypothetical protein
MQAILTKYIGATNTKGSRIKATCDAGSVTISYPHELSGDAVYRAAADALCKKLGWAHGELACGGLPNNGGYVFVFVNDVTLGK